MKTKIILKTLAMSMLLATACNKNEIANDENTDKKGFALPVTVNVTRQGDDATKATYNESTRKLAFSAGDKLFVSGSAGGYDYQFAGTLDYVSGGTFSGTIYIDNEWTGTFEELLEAVMDYEEVTATLLPAGYEDYGFLTIENNDPKVKYYDSVDFNFTYTLATSKATGVEQFSYEESTEYSSGFALKPKSTILNFTITGLAANTNVDVALTGNTSAYNITRTVTTDASGNATFAAGIYGGASLNLFSLTVGGNAITLPTKNAEVGKIYNISRSAAPATDLSTLTADYEAKDGDVLTGTLKSDVKISIADGATVTLQNVNITNLGDDCNWAGINCPGNATLVLKGINEVCAGRDDYGDSNYPGIWIAPGKTLTIQGDGKLTAYSNGTDSYGAGIGGGFEINCGNIVINSGTITATGGGGAAGIGSGGSGASCGNITINGGTVTATGDQYAAGIGSGGSASCGKITINGGTVTATGGEDAAGIGGGFGNEACGTITIKNTVTSVTATKGENAPNSIGAGNSGEDITVNIEDGANVIQN